LSNDILTTLGLYSSRLGLSRGDYEEEHLAPVPSQIISARKVLISNAGSEEIDSRIFFLPELDNNRAYDKFYAAVKSGGRYEPVLAPAGAAHK
jgi:hypothetical protein